MSTIGWVTIRWLQELDLSDESVQVLFPDEQLELEDSEDADLIDLFSNNEPSLIFSLKFFNSPTTDNMMLWVQLLFSRAASILFSTLANLSLKH